MMKRSVSAILVAISAFGFYAGGCSDDSDPTQVEEIDPGIIDGIQTNLTDPAALIEAHDRAWSQKSYAAYEALLDDTFEFHPLDDDVNDFPWLEGDSWGRTAEPGMAANMFDPNYSQGNGAVDLIEVDSTPQNAPQTLDDGTIRMTNVQIGRVMWTASDGASFDTRTEVDLVSRDGFLRIKRIAEIPRNLVPGSDSSIDPSSRASVEDSSWGQIKGLYR